MGKSLNDEKNNKRKRLKDNGATENYIKQKTLKEKFERKAAITKNNIW